MQKEVESHRMVNGFETFSQAYQDLFVRLMLDFKRAGTYLEVGASEPKQSNNTYILERDLDWNGLSLEIEKKITEDFNKVRRNKCICANAADLDYRDFFFENNFPKRIDYLSLDIDPSWATYAALKKIPFSDYRFSVITYEHDFYSNGPEYMLKSRELLESYGYVRVVENVLCCGRDFEDWYVDPTQISKEVYLPFKSRNIECEKIFDSLKKNNK